MRRISHVLIAVLLLSLLCSCGNEGIFLASPSLSGKAETSSASPTDIAGNTAAPTPTPSADVKVDNEARFKTFRTFLSDNYQGLSDAFFDGISGIGFIDLDMDGGIEMLIFDAGASAAMGLQFFDIINGEVECLSANMEAVGSSFGGEHMSKVVVNANRFDDFRLMQDNKTGEKFYIVQSGNGAADFSYSELIRFGCDNGVLTLKSLMYKFFEYDLNSGKITSELYKVKGTPAEKSEYDTAFSNFVSSSSDTGIDSKGAMLSENDAHESGLVELLAASEKAMTLYKEQENS